MKEENIKINYKTIDIVEQRGLIEITRDLGRLLSKEEFNEIIELKKYIKKDKKEIKKREKILSMIVDNDVEVEIEMYKEEIEKFTNELKTRKQLVKNYKKL